MELFAGGPWDIERVAATELEEGSDLDGNVFFDEPPPPLDVLFLELSNFAPFATPDVKCPIKVSTLGADLFDEPPFPLCLELTWLTKLPIKLVDGWPVMNGCTDIEVGVELFDDACCASEARIVMA